MKATIYSGEFRALCQAGDFEAIVAHVDAYSSDRLNRNNAYLTELVSKLFAEAEVLKVQQRALEGRLRQQYQPIGDERATEILDIASRNIDAVYLGQEVSREQACGITLNHILQQVWAAS